MNPGPAASPPKKPKRRIIRWVILVIVLLLLTPVVVAGAMYANDYPVEATVKDKKCTIHPSTVTVVTKSWGIEHTTEIPDQTCGILSEGNFVIYRLRSQHTTLYESEGGNCLWDSKSGHLCGKGFFGV